MHYVLLVIGILLAIYALHKLFLRANRKQIVAFIQTFFLLFFGVVLVFLAVTNKLGAALALAGGLFPLAKAWLNARREHKTSKQSGNIPMNEAEAYDVLGLSKGATEEDIKNAHKELMKKLHPDQGGNDYLAKKLNAAKDFLLKKKP